MTYAPVVITVYNRYWHFQQCVESLAKNYGADKTDLYIAIDAPYREEDKDSVNKVYEYAKAITGFKSLTIFMREINLGARENSLRSYESVFRTYDMIIMSEDDNIFSSDFLDYTNKGLAFYKDRKDIFAVCGYNYPIEMPSGYREDIYGWTGFNAWGFGTWKDRWDSLDLEPPIEELQSFLNNRNEMKKLDRIAGQYRPALQLIVETGEYTGDTIICYQLFRNSQISIFPSISRVKNIGHDGSGMHCGVDNSNRFKTQLVSDGKQAIRFEQNIKKNPKVYHVLSRYFRRPKLYRFKRFVKWAIHFDVSRDKPL